MDGWPFPYPLLGGQAMEHKLPLRLFFAHAFKPGVKRAAKTIGIGEGRSLSEHLRKPHMW